MSAEYTFRNRSCFEQHIQSETPQVRWSFHPERRSTSIFLGTGLDGGQNRIILQKYYLKDGMDVILEFYEGPILRYTVADLCFEPDKSALLKLYAQVAPTVIEAALAAPPRKVRRTIRN